MPSTYLTRTQTTGNRKTWTWSAWVKFSKIAIGSHDQKLFLAHNNTHPSTQIITNSMRLGIYTYDGASTNFNVTCNRYLRDSSGWFHLVIAVDTTQSTASDRVKIYINGVQETSFLTASYPSQNFDTQVNLNNVIAQVSGGGSPSNPFDGLMSHIHFTDGTAYAPTAFGEYDANGVWKIKTSPSVTYGTNGFFILKDGNSVTDQSGNSNNFTVAGGTLTKTEDSPSNVFCTLNPLDIGGGSYTFSNGNTKLFTNGGVQSTLSIGSSGKYYAEFKLATNNTSWLGIREQSYPISSGYGTGGKSVSLFAGGATAYKNGTNLGSGGYGSAWSTGDIMQIAVDKDNNYIYFGKNGSWWNGSSYASATPSTYITFDDIDNYMFSYVHGGGTDSTTEANFGNGYFGTTAVSSAGTNASGIGIFEFDCPVGYTALSTKGLNL